MRRHPRARPLWPRGVWGWTLGLCLLLTHAAQAQRATEAEPIDWQAVITRLQGLLDHQPGRTAVRQELATVYNNYGVALAQQGEWQTARAQVEQALSLEPDNNRFAENLANIYYNEAHEHYSHHRLPEAKASLEQGVRRHPTFAQAYVLLGQIEYESQELKAAQAAWEQALELNPSLDTIPQRLEQLRAELPIESEFERISQAYFDLRFEDALERPVGFDIRAALLEARREIGADFAYWPRYKIVVLIYSPESFRALRVKRPEWVSGEYDGKMRVRLPEGEQDIKAVKEILFHEYTHALVHDLTGGQCPRWFDEGLATYEGKRYGPKEFELLSTASAGDQLIPWDQLDQQFSFELSAEAVGLAYQQAYSIVSYLVERHGFWRIRRLLKAVSERRPMLDVLAAEFQISPARLERSWREWLPNQLK